MLIKNHWFLCQYIMKWMLSYCKMGTLETLFQNCVVWSVNTNVLKEDMFLIEASLVYRPQTMSKITFEQKPRPLLVQIRYVNRRASLIRVNVHTYQIYPGYQVLSHVKNAWQLCHLSLSNRVKTKHFLVTRKSPHYFEQCLKKQKAHSLFYFVYI